MFVLLVMLFTYRICSSLGTQCSFCHIHQHILQEKFQTGCVGPCEPDLTVDIQQDTSPIVYGETTEFYITVSVMNKGEVAFGLRTTIDVTTNNAQFLSATTLLDKGSVPITCSEGVDNNRTVLHCDHTNALFQQQLGLVRLRYNVSTDALLMNMNYTNLLTAVNFKATSVSEGNEIKEADNTNMLTQDITFRANLQIYG